ncbi:phage N-6-adenine-methyltransferase [Vagococcus lutrae]|nr:phage N-6-adenine-methyltransferase [Vagococcus lutrae]
MNMNREQLFTSNKQDWETPQWLFDELNDEFNFELDAMATEQNAKCDIFFTKEDDALKKDWSQYNSIFINPPYQSSVQNAVLKKAYETNKNYGNTIVLLIPARTDTARWHEHIFGKAEIRFLKGRLKFEVDGIEYKDAATFPSAIVIYRKGGHK